jgi:hypothetical protein
VADVNLFFERFKCGFPGILDAPEWSMLCEEPRYRAANRICAEAASITGQQAVLLASLRKSDHKPPSSARRLFPSLAGARRFVEAHRTGYTMCVDAAPGRLGQWSLPIVPVRGMNKPKLSWQRPENWEQVSASARSSLRVSDQPSHTKPVVAWRPKR